MAANNNNAPKIHAFTLLYCDTESGEHFSHQFMHDEEYVYGEELDKLLLMPAEETWHEIYQGDIADSESVRNMATYLKVVAVIPGHVEAVFPEEYGAIFNPKLDIFGKPRLHLV